MIKKNFFFQKNIFIEDIKIIWNKVENEKIEFSGLFEAIKHVVGIGGIVWQFKPSGWLFWPSSGGV